MFLGYIQAICNILELAFLPEIEGILSHKDPFMCSWGTYIQAICNISELAFLPEIEGIYIVIMLPAHPASFVHKFLFQRVTGCNSMADLSLKIVFWTH